jgi:two-component system response regulator
MKSTISPKAALPFNLYNGSSKAATKKLSIIIADDNADDQLLVQNAFRLIDPTIEHSSVFNGLQLIDLLSNTGVYATSYNYCPNAIILDLNMPVMDGLAALKTVRKLEFFKKIPVYILHTLRKDDYLNQCSELGVQGIYTKPSSFKALQIIAENIYHACGGEKGAYQMLK